LIVEHMIQQSSSELQWLAPQLCPSSCAVSPTRFANTELVERESPYAEDRSHTTAMVAYPM
jgi:hypothetical protein